jgi:hypothetical protein
MTSPALYVSDNEIAKPRRLRLSRAKSFNLQLHSRAINGLPALNAARPGPLGNPFVVGVEGTRQECVELHIYLLHGKGLLCLTCKASLDAQKKHRAYVMENRKRFAGHNIACWCSLPKPGEADLCHGATLIEAFNP